MSEEITEIEVQEQPAKEYTGKRLKQEYPPVYILLRTGGRPNFFDICYRSIRQQDYPNVVLITHINSVSDTYALGDVIVSSPHVPRTTKGFYNLFCNTLLQAIPDDADGWYCFIDDDDKYCAPDVISRFVAKAKKNAVNVAKVSRLGKIFPISFGEEHKKSFQTECFLLHTSHKNKATWWDQTGGDHYYTSQLTAKMPVNWVDNLMICEAISGKGYGKRLDYQEQEVFARHKSITTVCGDRKYDSNFVFVKYLHQVKGNPNCAGLKNAQRWIHKDYADELLKQGKVEVLKQGGVDNGTDADNPK